MQEAQQETKEAFGSPDEPEHFFGDVESGVANGKGWRLQGYIEAADGSLRPQTYEESLTCVGCHGAIGRGVDSIISFPRKLAEGASAGGWYHWNAERPLGAIRDQDGEYARYLRENLAADEFRANDEAWGRFLTLRATSTRKGWPRCAMASRPSWSRHPNGPWRWTRPTASSSASRASPRAGWR